MGLANCKIPHSLEASAALHKSAGLQRIKLKKQRKENPTIILVNKISTCQFYHSNMYPSSGDGNQESKKYLSASQLIPASAEIVKYATNIHFLTRHSPPINTTENHITAGFSKTPT
ncbi:hypothetical protein CH372_19975 [Leptospira meyeri]|nr:hypothetical protein CH372_19975 [Leptospira meyeri]